MPYNPSLDVLRVFAAVLVIAFHSLVLGFRGGWIGVDLFFVLSGFLITNLLLAEKQRAGRIDVVAFWIRRFRRLAPAFYVMLACYLLVARWVWPDYPLNSSLRDAGMAAAYVSDYQMAYGPTATVIGHTWSLAIEEKFYLLWPLILIALLKSGKHLRSWLLVMIGCAMIVRWTDVWRGAYWSVLYYPFHNRLTGLLLGAGAALLYKRVERPAVAFVLGLSSFCTALCFIRWSSDDAVRYWMLLAEIGALLMVLGCWSKPLLLSSLKLSWMGKYTYGMYLWHILFVNVPAIFAFGPVGMFPAALLGSFALSLLSYHTVEKPFRSRLAVKTHNAAIHEVA